jgi:AraC-like DNA-binding protein
VRFSAGHLPFAHRLEIWRGIFGREVIRLDMAPLKDGPVFHDAVFRDFGSAALGPGVVSAISCERTPESLGDGSNDIILPIQIADTVSLQQHGAEPVARSGDVPVRRSVDAGRTPSSSGCYKTVIPGGRHRQADRDRAAPWHERAEPADRPYPRAAGQRGRYFHRACAGAPPGPGVRAPVGSGPGRRPIRPIALEAGFGAVSDFNRAFRKH